MPTATTIATTAAARIKGFLSPFDLIQVQADGIPSLQTFLQQQACRISNSKTVYTSPSAVKWGILK